MARYTTLKIETCSRGIGPNHGMFHWLDASSNICRSKCLHCGIYLESLKVDFPKQATHQRFWCVVFIATIYNVDFELYCFVKKSYNDFK